MEKVSSGMFWRRLRANSSCGADETLWKLWCTDASDLFRGCKTIIIKEIQLRHQQGLCNEIEKFSSNIWRAVFAVLQKFRLRWWCAARDIQWPWATISSIAFSFIRTPMLRITHARISTLKLIESAKNISVQRWSIQFRFTDSLLRFIFAFNTKRLRLCYTKTSCCRFPRALTYFGKTFVKRKMRLKYEINNNHLHPSRIRQP